MDSLNDQIAALLKNSPTRPHEYTPEETRRLEETADSIGLR